MQTLKNLCILAAMQTLNLPAISVKQKKDSKHQYIWDIVRKKYVVLQPEEWVRQHLIHYFHHQLGYPFSLMLVEKQLKSAGRIWRADIVLYDSSGIPKVLVECKAPDIQLSEETFLQAAKYNSVYQVPMLIISNGLQHYGAEVNLVKGSCKFLKKLPDFKTINT